MSATDARLTSFSSVRFTYHRRPKHEDNDAAALLRDKIVHLTVKQRFALHQLPRQLLFPCRENQVAKRIIIPGNILKLVNPEATYANVSS